MPAGTWFSATKTRYNFCQPGRVEPWVGTVGRGCGRHVPFRAAPRSSQSKRTALECIASDLFGVDTVSSGSRRPCSAVRCDAAGGRSPARPVNAHWPHERIGPGPHGPSRLPCLSRTGKSQRRLRRDATVGSRTGRVDRLSGGCSSRASLPHVGLWHVRSVRIGGDKHLAVAVQF